MFLENAFLPSLGEHEFEEWKANSFFLAWSLQFKCWISTTNLYEKEILSDVIWERKYVLEEGTCCPTSFYLLFSFDV